MSKKIKFFKEAVKNYKTSGTVVPSSRFLAKRMLSNVNFSKAKVIVELGPGNGAITRKILKKIKSDAILICFEINEEFFKDLQKINHPQLVLVKESAENVKEELNKLGFDMVDYIVSSLPLTIIPKEISHNILNQLIQCKRLIYYFLTHLYINAGGKFKVSKPKLIFSPKTSLSFP